MNQKLLRLTLTVGASALFSILVVFVVVNAQSKLTSTALEVKGTATIESTTNIWGGAFLNSAGDDANSTGLIVRGKLGVGNKFAITAPVHRLDVDGDINFTGTLYQNNSPFKTSPWLTSAADANNIYYNTGYIGIGTNTPASAREVSMVNI